MRTASASSWRLHVGGGQVCKWPLHQVFASLPDGDLMQLAVSTSHTASRFLLPSSPNCRTGDRTDLEVDKSSLNELVLHIHEPLGHSSSAVPPLTSVVLTDVLHVCDTILSVHTSTMLLLLLRAALGKLLRCAYLNNCISQQGIPCVSIMPHLATPILPLIMSLFYSILQSFYTHTHTLLILQSFYSHLSVLYTPIWRVGGVLHEPVSRQRRWLERSVGNSCQLMTRAP